MYLWSWPRAGCCSRTRSGRPSSGSGTAGPGGSQRSGPPPPRTRASRPSPPQTSQCRPRAVERNISWFRMTHTGTHLVGQLQHVHVVRVDGVVEVGKAGGLGKAALLPDVRVAGQAVITATVNDVGKEVFVQIWVFKYMRTRVRRRSRSSPFFTYTAWCWRPWPG